MFLSRLADFPLEYAHALVGTSKAHLCPQRTLSYRYEGPLGLLYGASKPKAQPNSLLPKSVWPDAEKLGKKMGCAHARLQEKLFLSGHMVSAKLMVGKQQ